MKDVVIIGGGAAGLTAAVYVARAGFVPTLLSGPLPGGLLTQTGDVENFPGFPESINGYALMHKFQKQAERFGTEMVSNTLEKVMLSPGGGHKLILKDGAVIECKALIIATGSTPRYLGLESEKAFMNRGVSACATCDGAFFRNVPVVVVGGGDTAMEEATFLTRFASEVHVIHRRDQLRASKIMADRALANPKIKFHWNSVVTEVFGEKDVDGVKLNNLLTHEETTLPCKGYFVALGHVPNTAPFVDQIELDEAGYIVLKGQSSYTSMEGVFAAGDCADNVYKQAITAAGMGARAAIDATRFLES